MRHHHRIRPALPRRQPAPRRAPARRGLASLLVVMMLFFVISLVAAYTSRSLIFEQRTSANQYRSTQALEAADAGVEWTLARLNESRMDDDCRPLANAGLVNAGSPQDSFRERYLSIDATTGALTPVVDRVAGCVFNGSDWVCDCPVAGNPAPTPAFVGNGPFPAFWVRFVMAGPPATTPALYLQVNSCTRFDPSCLRFDREAQSGDGIATAFVVPALRHGMLTAPGAPLTARGGVNVQTFSTLSLTNTDRASGGITVHTGGPMNPYLGGLSLSTIPGMPGENSTAGDDPALAFPDLTLTPATPANQGANRMFAAMFGLWPASYADQPGARVVDCASG